MAPFSRRALFMYPRLALNSPSSSFFLLGSSVCITMLTMVLESLTWILHGDGGLGQVSRDRRRHVFRKMQLTTSSVDKEFSAGMMITAACRPRPDLDKGIGHQVDCSPRAGCAPDLCSRVSHGIRLPCHGGGLVQGSIGKEQRQRL